MNLESYYTRLMLSAYPPRQLSISPINSTRDSHPTNSAQRSSFTKSRRAEARIKYGEDSSPMKRIKLHREIETDIELINKPVVAEPKLKEASINETVKLSPVESPSCVDSKSQVSNEADNKSLNLSVHSVGISESTGVINDTLRSIIPFPSISNVDSDLVHAEGEKESYFTRFSTASSTKATDEFSEETESCMNALDVYLNARKSLVHTKRHKTGFCAVGPQFGSPSNVMAPNKRSLVETSNFAEMLTEMNEVKRVRHLIEAGASMDSLDEWGLAPLHWLAIKGRSAVAKKLLISSKCDLDLRDAEGRTPLHWAAKEGRSNMAKLLVSSKCDLEVKDAEGRTPLHWAAKEGQYNVVKLLISSKCDLDLMDKKGRTPLHWAVKDKYYAMAELLISNKCNLDLIDKEGRTPLLLAADNESKRIVELLLQRGAKVNCPDNENYTLLHFSSRHAWADIVQLILHSGEIEVNAATRHGLTPLMCATIREHRDVIKQLLAAGADTNLKNSDNKMSLSIYLKLESHSLEIISLFVQKGAFFEDDDFAVISKDPLLKEKVLKDVDLCTQSVVNKFSYQALPALYSSPYFVRMLPSMDNFKLSTSQKDEVKKFVRQDIQLNTFCNIVRVRPTSLSALCIQSLAAYITRQG